MKKFNFVYKTTFTDGRYYIGQHKTDDLNDNYFGSSQEVQLLVKEHPELKPIRTILEYCDTQDELNKKEKYYIGDLYKNDPLCLNKNNACYIIDYTNGVPWHIVHSTEYKEKKSKMMTGEGNPMYGKKHSEDTRKKMSVAQKGKIPWNKGKKGAQVPWNKGIKNWMSEEGRKRVSESRKGKITNGMKGKHHSKETKNKISDKLRNKKCKWMTNNIISMRVSETDQQQYIELGYIFGRKTNKVLEKR